MGASCLTASHSLETSENHSSDRCQPHEGDGTYIESMEKAPMEDAQKKKEKSKKERNEEKKKSGRQCLPDETETPTGAEAWIEDTKESKKKRKKENEKDKKKSKKTGGKSLQEETEEPPAPGDRDDEAMRKLQQQLQNKDDEILSLRTFIEDKELELNALHEDLKKTTAELEAAKEEIAVKVAQVKQYQKQVESYKQQAQPKNEFEQLYHEEKERNARRMEEIDRLKKNEFEQLYHDEKERNALRMEEIDRLKKKNEFEYHQLLQVNAQLSDEIDQLKRRLAQATQASSSRQEEERNISDYRSSPKPPQKHRGSFSPSKATTEPAHARIFHDSDDDLPPPVILPKAHHPPKTFPHSSSPNAHRVVADQMTSLVDIPLDPNLVCPVCRKKFRKGEIQLYKQHVDLCGQAGDIV